MSDSHGSGPPAHDQPWRIWASVAVVATVLSGALLGVLIIPVVQGRGAGIDAYTAICRALNFRDAGDATDPATPVSQVTWTPDVLRVIPMPNRTGSRQVLKSAPATARRRIGGSGFHILPGTGAAIYKQLHDYRTGSRTHPLMTDIAKALTNRLHRRRRLHYAAQPNAIQSSTRAITEPIVRLVEPAIRTATLRPARLPSAGLRHVNQPIPLRTGATIVLQLKEVRVGSVATMYGQDNQQSRRADGRLAAYYRAGFK